MLRWSCERATEEDLRAIAGKIEQVESICLETHRDQRITAGLQFFDTLAQAAHNKALTVILDSLSALIKERLRDVAVADALPQLNSTRHEILNGLKARDEAQANAAFGRYLEQLESNTASL